MKHLPAILAYLSCFAVGLAFAIALCIAAGRPIPNPEDKQEAEDHDV